jgi:hypothetical protein
MAHSPASERCCPRCHDPAGLSRVGSTSRRGCIRFAGRAAPTSIAIRVRTRHTFRPAANTGPTEGDRPESRATPQAGQRTPPCRSSDSAARRSLGDLPLKLASAHLVLAREHGSRAGLCWCTTSRPTLRLSSWPLPTGAANEHAARSQRGPTSPTLAGHDSCLAVAETARRPQLRAATFACTTTLSTAAEQDHLRVQ